MTLIARLQRHSVDCKRCQHQDACPVADAMVEEFVRQSVSPMPVERKEPPS